MPLHFVLDEHLRGPLWRAIQRHNAIGLHHLDVVRVGDHKDLPLGAPDEIILSWAQSQSRIVVSEDRATMIAEFEKFVRSAQYSPGLLLIRPNSKIPDVIHFLTAMAHASELLEWTNGWFYIP